MTVSVETPAVAARPSIAALILLSAISPLAINVFVPSMPSIAADLDAPYTTIQFGLSLYLFCVAAMQLVIGPASDRMGRKPVLIAGIALFLLGTVMCILATTPGMFLAGRIVQSASAVGIVLSRAIVRDVYPREKSASMIGYVVMGMAIAPMIGPAIGGFLDGVAGWRSSFVLLAIFGAIALLATFRLPETNRNAGQSIAQQMASYRALLSMPVFWLYSLAAGLAAGVFFAFLGGGPVVSTGHFSQTPFEYGVYFASCSIGYSIGNFLTGRYSERVGIERMMQLGALITLAGPVLALTLFAMGADHPVSFFGPMLLVGVGNGLTLPNVTAAAISLRPEAAGAASGLLGSLQIFISAGASVLGAWAAGSLGSPVSLTLAMTVLAILALILTELSVRFTPRETH